MTESQLEQPKAPSVEPGSKPVVGARTPRRRKKKRVSREKRIATWNWLCETFPKAFTLPGGNFKPLKLGVFEDLYAYIESATVEVPGRKAIRITLRSYVHHHGYLKACIAGAARVDLNGKESGVVTDAQAVFSMARLQKENSAFLEKQKATSTTTESVA